MVHDPRNRNTAPTVVRLQQLGQPKNPKLVAVLAKPDGLVNDSLVELLENYLVDSYPMRRRPYAAARLLALICGLHERGLPFPTRDEAAALCLCTRDGIDAALNVALARGNVTCEDRYTHGQIVQRPSVRKERYMTPSQPIQTIARAVLRKHNLTMSYN